MDEFGTEPGTYRLMVMDDLLYSTLPANRVSSIVSSLPSTTPVQISLQSWSEVSEARISLYFQQNTHSRPLWLRDLRKVCQEYNAL